VIAVGLLACGGAEDGPALSVMSRIDDVQEVYADPETRFARSGSVAPSGQSG